MFHTLPYSSSVLLSLISSPHSGLHFTTCTVKKVSGFPFPRDVTDQTLPGREKLNYSHPGRLRSMTSRLGTGKLLTFFYSVLTSSFITLNTMIYRALSCTGRGATRRCRLFGLTSSATKYVHIKSTTVYAPRRNWDSPNPFLASECSPPPRNRGEGAHKPAGGGWGGVPIPWRNMEQPYVCSPCPV
jgi:hypothetical protein